MDASNPSKSAGKLESLPKEELLKYIKKQAIQAKDLKKKVEDLTKDLSLERDEVVRLESEKKSWLSRGVSAELEKKEKLTKKNQELQLAAQLGKEMLAENDNLREQCKQLEDKYEAALVKFETDFQNLLNEKGVLVDKLSAVEKDLAASHKEAQECKDALETAVVHRDDDYHNLIKENEVLKKKVQDFQEQLKSNSPHNKLVKMKERLDGISKENKLNKESKAKLEEENEANLKLIASLESEIKQVKKELSESQKRCKSNENEVETLSVKNSDLQLLLQATKEQCQELDDEVHRLKIDKEKSAKSLKSMKTKYDRTVQMEEELKKHLNSMSCEREDLFNQVQKLQKEKKALQQKSKVKSRSLDTEDCSDRVKELESLVLSCESENSELQKVAKKCNEQSDEMHFRYENLQRDFERLSFEIDEITMMKNAVVEERDLLQTQGKELTEQLNRLEQEKVALVEEHKHDQQVLLEECRLLEQKLDAMKSKASMHDVAAMTDSVKLCNDSSVRDACHVEESSNLLSKQQDRASELLKQLQTLNEEKLHQEQALEELFKSHDDLQNKYDFECGERQKAESQLHRLEERLGVLQAENLPGKDQTKLELERQILDLEETLSIQSNDSARVRQEVNIKEQQIAQLRNEIEMLSKKQVEIVSVNNAQDKKIESLYFEVDTFRGQLRDAKERLEDAVCERDEHNRMMFEVSEKLRRTGEALSLTHEQLRQTELQLGAAQDDVGSLRNLLSAVEVELQVQRSKTVEAEARLLEAERKLHSACMELENLRVNVEDAGGKLREDKTCLVTEVALLQTCSLPADLGLDDDKREVQVTSLEGEERWTHGEAGERKFTSTDWKTVNVEQVESLVAAHSEVIADTDVVSVNMVEQNPDPNFWELDVQALGERLDTAVPESRILAANADYAKEEILRMKSAVEELEKQLSSSRNEAAEYLSQLVEKETELQHIVSRNASFEAEVKNSAECLQHLREAWSAEKCELQQRQRVLGGKIDDYLLRVRERKSDVAERLVECFQLDADAFSQQADLESSFCAPSTFDLERNIEELCRAFDQEVDCRDAYIRALSEKCRAAEETYSGLQQLFSDKCQEYSAVLLQYESSKNSCCEMQALLSRMTSEYSESAASSRAEIAVLLEEVATKQHEVAVMESKLRDFEHLVEAADEKLASKCRELELLQADNSSLSKQLEIALDANTDQKGELDRLERLLDERERKEEMANVLEGELQSALNRIDDLESQVKLKCDEAGQLDLTLKDKGDRMNKFKNAAIKAKRDLEVLRQDFASQQKNATITIDRLREQLQKVQHDLAYQISACEKHEEDFETTQKEIKSLHSAIQEKDEANQRLSDVLRHSDEAICQQKAVAEECSAKLEDVLVKLSTRENELAATQKALEEKARSLASVHKDMQLRDLKLEELETKLVVSETALTEARRVSDESLRKLESAQKESQQMQVIRLEIDDYHRTIETLQSRVSEKDVNLSEAFASISKLDETVKDLDSKRGKLLSDLTESEDRNKKLKSMVIKLKKDVADSRQKEIESQEAQAELLKNVEMLHWQLEDAKLQLSNSASEKETIVAQMKSSLDANERAYGALEVRYAQSKSELLAAVARYDELYSEFEKYKVRAHSVLKQQKAAQDEVALNKPDEEKMRLSEAVEQLRVKLQETSLKLQRVSSDRDELESEHERLQTRHSQFVQEVSNKETGWKQRFEQMKVELNVKLMEQQERIKVLTLENEDLSGKCKEAVDAFSKAQAERSAEQKLLQDEVKKLKWKAEDVPLPVPLADSTSRMSSGRSDTALVLDLHRPILSLERSEGEGMDQSQLELIDTLSQRSPSSVPSTPVTPSAAGILEKILSPIGRDAPRSVFLQSPTTEREDVEKLKTALTESYKKVEHLTELLRDTEANSSRLSEQALILKEEIRRLERNEQREKALSNMEYLKNVIIKFLKVGVTEKEQLIPVLSTMLKLSSEEKDFLVEYAKGASEEPTSSGGWSSYVYRWTSIS